MATYKRWKDIKAQKKLGDAEIAEIDAWVKEQLLEMDLREIRLLVGETQEDLAEKLKASQAEVSRFERREDFRISTLKRYIEALGGELEVYATFGDKKVRLRSAA